MGLSIWQILIVVVLLVLLFGRGKISELMGDVAKGIKSFKKGMSEEDKPTSSLTSEHEQTIDVQAQAKEDSRVRKDENSPS
ncbi:MAG: twin-arginine translocase TatA/TatE family subunit [Alphaproteobacteria bacterium]|jgi:sec-independent protein translocase protein TatA|nr:twin-arginine translocase TatA/TatE family subunit [Alphaproteobacteria bacterium]